MKKRRLSLVIEAGDKTCASEPGKFCRFLGSTKFGSVPVCLLFPSANPKGGDSHTSLQEGGGWVQRCAACLEAERDIR